MKGWCSVYNPAYAGLLYCDIIPVMRIEEVAERAARWLLIGFAFLLPIFVIPTAWAQVAQAKTLLLVAGLSLVLIVFVVERIFGGSMKIPRHPLLLASILLPIAYLASALGSQVGIGSYISGFGGVDTVAAVALFFATLVLFALLFTGKNVLYPILAFSAGASVVILFQIARLFIPDWLTLGGAMSGSASSLIGSWHDLGIFTALFVFLAIVFIDARDAIPRLVRIAFGALGLLGFALLLIIGFSDVWYALGGLTVLYGVYTYAIAHVKNRRLHKEALRSAALVIVFGVVALAAGYYSSKLLQHLPSSLQISQLEVRPSWQTTYSIGEKVFTSGDALFGTGPETFSNAWGKWKPLSVNQTDYWSLDFRAGVGLIPTAFITAGVLGALAWLLLVVILVLRLVYVRDIEPKRETMRHALLAATLFLLWFHIFYAPGPTISIILFMLLGLVVASDMGPKLRTYTLPLRVSSIPGIVSILAVIFVSTGIVFAAGATARVTVSNLYIAKASTAYAAGKSVSEVLALVRRSLFIYPGNSVAHRAAVQVGLLELRELLSKGENADAAALKSTLERTIAEGLRAVEIDSTDYQNWLALASLYQNLAVSGIPGAYDQALVAYTKAAEASPTNPIPFVNAAQLAMVQGGASSSVAYLNKAIALKPNLAVAYYLRSQAKGSLGEFPGAIEDAKAAITLAREDALGWYNLGTLFYASSNYADAVLTLSQAVSLQNDYANALFVLSLAWQKQNNYPAAIAAMQRVADLNPDNQMVKDALTQIMTASTTPATEKKK